MRSHIAPPNWYTYCGKHPDEVLAMGETAYDTCSLDEHLDDPTKWCKDCVAELRKESEELNGSSGVQANGS